ERGASDARARSTAYGADVDSPHGGAQPPHTHAGPSDAGAGPPASGAGRPVTNCSWLRPGLGSLCRLYLKQTSERSRAVTTTILNVPDISCEHCERAIT